MGKQPIKYGITEDNKKGLEELAQKFDTSISEILNALIYEQRMAPPVTMARTLAFYRKNKAR